MVLHETLHQERARPQDLRVDVSFVDVDQVGIDGTLEGVVIEAELSGSVAGTLATSGRPCVGVSSVVAGCAAEL